MKKTICIYTCIYKGRRRLRRQETHPRGDRKGQTETESDGETASENECVMRRRGGEEGYVERGTEMKESDEEKIATFVFFSFFLFVTRWRDEGRRILSKSLCCTFSPHRYTRTHQSSRVRA